MTKELSSCGGNVNFYLIEVGSHIKALSEECRMKIVALFSEGTPAACSNKNGWGKGSMVWNLEDLLLKTKKEMMVSWPGI